MSATPITKWRYLSESWMASQLPRGEGKGEGIPAALSCPAAVPQPLAQRQKECRPVIYPKVDRFVSLPVTLVNTAIDLEPVTAAIDDVDQAFGIELDRGGTP